MTINTETDNTLKFLKCAHLCLGVSVLATEFFCIADGSRHHGVGESPDQLAISSTLNARDIGVAKYPNNAKPKEHPSVPYNFNMTSPQNMMTTIFDTKPEPKSQRFGITRFQWPYN